MTNRGNGEVASCIKLTSDIKTLQLTLKSDVAPKKYKIIIRTVDEDLEVWTSPVQKSPKRSMFLNMPAKNLKRGDYEILLVNLKAMKKLFRIILAV